MYLFFDTETTGFVKKDIPLDSTQQPAIVQLAYILDNESRVSVKTSGMILPKNPDKIHGAQHIHGISENDMLAYSILKNLILDDFIWAVERADVIIAHNITFDLDMLKIEFPDLDLKGKELVCTQRNATNVCKLPGKYGYKWPKLEEAYRMLVNASGFSGAHNAVYDTLACREVFYKLKDQASVVHYKLKSKD